MDAVTEGHHVRHDFMADSDSWFFLPAFLLGPVCLIGILAPIPLWALAVAAPAGLAAWAWLFRSPRGRSWKNPLTIAAVAIGVLAAVAGEIDDAPGLVLLGMVCVGGAVAYVLRSIRRTRRSAHAS